MPELPLTVNLRQEDFQVKILRIASSALIILASALPLHSYGLEWKRPKEPLDMVLSAVERYKEAIACSTNPIDQSEVIAISGFRSTEDRFNAKYAVLWYGDIGCAGGSGTGFKQIAIVKVGAGDKFYVDTELSSPRVDLDFPVRGFERLVNYSAGQMIIDAADWAPTDANCCPSIRARYTLKADDKGNWKQVSKQLLPRGQ